MAVAAAKRQTPPGATPDDSKKIDLDPSRGDQTEVDAASEEELVDVEPDRGPGFAPKDKDAYVPSPGRQMNPAAFAPSKKDPISDKVTFAGSQWEKADLKAHPNLHMALAAIESYKRGEVDAQAMGVELKNLFESEDFKNPKNKAFYDAAVDKLYIGLVDSMKYRVRKQYPKKYKAIVAEIEKNAPKTSAQVRKENRVFSGSELVKDKRFSGSVDVSWGYVWLQALEKVAGLDLGLLIKNPSFARVEGSVNIPVRHDLVVTLGAYVGASSIEGFASEDADGTKTITATGETLGLDGGKTTEFGVKAGFTNWGTLGPATLGLGLEYKQLVGTDTNIAGNGRVLRGAVWYDRKIEIPAGKGGKNFITLQGPFGRWAVFHNFNQGGRLYPEEPYPGAPETNDRRIGGVYDKFPWYASVGFIHYRNGRPDTGGPAAYSMLGGLQQVLTIEGFKTQNAAIRGPVASIVGYRVNKAVEGDNPGVRDIYNTLGLLQGVSGFREGTGVALIGLQMSDVLRRGNFVHKSVMVAASAARLGVSIAKGSESTESIKEDVVSGERGFDALYDRDTARLASVSEGLSLGIGVFDAFAVDPYIKKHPVLYGVLGGTLVAGGATLLLASAPISGSKCAGSEIGRCSFGSTDGFFENAIPELYTPYSRQIRQQFAIMSGSALMVYPIVKAIPFISDAIARKRKSKQNAKSGESRFTSFQLMPKKGGVYFSLSGKF